MAQEAEKVTHALTQQQQKWLGALRSGKYNQGKIHLHYSPKIAEPKFNMFVVDKYCAMGVACAVLTNNPEEITVNAGGVYKYAGEGYYPPTTIQQALHMLPNAYKKVTAMNDAGGKTFKQIADYIEKHPKEFFE